MQAGPPGEVQVSEETFHEGSVVAVLARDFARQSVLEQTRVKARLQEAVAAATTVIAAADRIVLDLGEGFAVVLLGRPEDALEVAQRALAAAADVSLCLGVNYGPLKLLHEDVVGDGVVAAITIAKLATRGRILVSRSFRDALRQSAIHRAAALAPVGAFSDANLRKHELFALDAGAASAHKRRLMILSGLGIAGILAASLGVRAMRSDARKPAVIMFDIAPQGEIYVDGKLKGASPPLKRLEVSPGEHVVEVRHSLHPPLKLTIDVKAGQEMKLAHSFQTGKRTQRGGREESFIEQLRRKLGN